MEAGRTSWTRQRECFPPTKLPNSFAARRETSGPPVRATRSMRTSVTKAALASLPGHQPTQIARNSLQAADLVWGPAAALPIVQHGMM